MDVTAWLQGLGFEHYAPAFHDNEIDWDALPKLTAEDLKDLGVVPEATGASSLTPLPRSVPLFRPPPRWRQLVMHGLLPPMPNAGR
ncbi:MAG: SAM domain-containing protein [Stellaceae bacterium]